MTGGSEGEGKDQDATPSMVAGMEPDREVQDWLEEAEAGRRAKEEAEGKGVPVVVYTPPSARVGTWGQRVLTVIVLVIILVPLLWFVVIPRADAELVIQYHEGAVGGISVDARIENHGTRAMDELQLRITVQDSGDIRMAEPSIYEGIVGAHDEAPMDAIVFTGDQWDTYHIFVEWSFECAGSTYTGAEHYDTEGTEMNIWFHHDLTP
jgi:hypothetical protein